MLRQLSLGFAAVTAFTATALAGGATAHAETGGEPVGTPTGTVVLPTGDAVTVLPGGGTGLLPAEGREDVGFLTVPAPDGSGDTLVIPRDKADEITAGREGPRRYNVTDLAAAGIADAGAVGESELDGIGDAGLTGAAVASESRAAWTFDFGPAALGEEGVALRSLPTVAFDAEDVEGGWADAHCRQEVTLAFEPGVHEDPGAPLTALGMEVSYDDGRTWTEVDLDRDGDTAEATLRRPWNARFVSTRVNAADDRGNEIAYTTIRSYGLR